jgi:phage tail sheath protein FI
MIYLTHALKELTQWAVFENNDQILWATLESQIDNYLTGLWQSRAFRGSTAEQAFFVKCDEENNPLSAIENGVVNIEIGVALQYPAEFVVIKLAQWEGGSSAGDNA